MEAYRANDNQCENDGAVRTDPQGYTSGPLYARHRAQELRSVPCVVCPRYLPDGQDLKEIPPVFNVHEEVPFWRIGHAPGERAPQKGVHIDDPEVYQKGPVSGNDRQRVQSCHMHGNTALDAHAAGAPPSCEPADGQVMDAQIDGRPVSVCVHSVHHCTINIGTSSDPIERNNRARGMTEAQPSRGLSGPILESLGSSGPPRGTPGMIQATQAPTEPTELRNLAPQGEEGCPGGIVSKDSEMKRERAEEACAAVRMRPVEPTDSNALEPRPGRLEPPPEPDFGAQMACVIGEDTVCNRHTDEVIGHKHDRGDLGCEAGSVWASQGVEPAPSTPPPTGANPGVRPATTHRCLERTQA